MDLFPRRITAVTVSRFVMAHLLTGGAKTVILDRPGLDEPRAYRALGRAVESMGGLFTCGPDAGTGDA